jgi:hypothetical protein
VTRASLAHYLQTESSGKYFDITAIHLEGISKPQFITIWIQRNLLGPWCIAGKTDKGKPAYDRGQKRWCVDPVLAAGRYVSFFMHDTGNTVSISAQCQCLKLYDVCLVSSQQDQLIAATAGGLFALLLIESSSDSALIIYLLKTGKPRS